MVWSPFLNLSWIRDEARVPDLTFAFSKMTYNSGFSFISRPIPETIDTLSKRFFGFSRRMNDRLDFPNTMANVKVYARDHPVFLFLLIALAFICSLPILAFVSFVVATLGFTFLGFLLIEGTLLTVGTFLLSGVLFVLGFLALGFSAFVAAAWFIVNKIFNVVSAASDKLSIAQSNSRPVKPTIGNGLHHYD